MMVKGGWVPLVNICVYGQDEDSKWNREFRYIFPNVKKDTVEQIAEKEAEDMGLNDWYSWGVDSTVAYKNIYTGEVDELGSALFIDCDIKGRGAINDIKMLVSLLMKTSGIKVEPDIYKTKNGVHLYFFQVLRIKRLKEIMKLDFIRDVVDPKFTGSTIKLGSSVLRLSDYKKGEISEINSWKINSEFCDDCKHLTFFVKNMLNGRR